MSYVVIFNRFRLQPLNIFDKIFLLKFYQVFDKYISFTVIFNIKYSLIHILYEMCTFNSFYLKMSFKISLMHHIILFVVQDQHGLKSQIRHSENCWLASISPELMVGKHFTRGHVRVLYFTHKY